MSDAGMKLEGGCLCGAIRYCINGKVRFVSQCCCRDCQRATGTGHTTIIGVLRSDLSDLRRRLLRVFVGQIVVPSRCRR